MGTEIQCPSCHKQIEKDSAFCRYCGWRIPQADEDLQAILDRTADFVTHFEDAVDAISEYFTRWPDGQEARDVSFTRNCTRLFFNIVNLRRGKFEAVYEDSQRLANDAGLGLPTLLANGLATSAQVKDPEKRKEILAFLSVVQADYAPILQGLYDAAEKECQSLLVDGKSQAQIKRVTREDAYRDAEVHYASFEKRELDAALQGFRHLKELNPKDFYFRNLVGSILLQQEKPLPALQEFLFGLSLNPEDVHLTSNTLRCLCGLALFPAAVEVARHYEKIGGDPNGPTIRPWAALARAATAAVFVKLSRCTAEDLSATTPDLIDELELPEHPWLAEPKTCPDSKNVLSEARIFISYRRSGGLDYAEHLERALKGACPSIHVFRDESYLVPGQDFVDQLRDEIDQADLFLALIDQNWAGGKGKDSRLNDRKDILRREVARAFQMGVSVIPVLLEGAQMPSRSDLPDELNDFSQLHAQRLTEAAFDSDLGLLQSAMTRLLTERKLEERAIDKELEDLEKLLGQDPKAAKEKMDGFFAPPIGDLPKYVPGKSVHGEGVTSSVELEGVWECTATGPGGQVTLRFTTEGTQGTPFQGEIRVKEGGMMSLWNRGPEEIKGTWMPVIDVDKDLLLGLFLDGLKSGAPYKRMIPFHRRLGNDLVGTDSDGVTYSSRNVEPRSKGF